MCPAHSYHLRKIKLLIKYELLQSLCYGFLLLLKFDMNVISWGRVTYNRGRLT